MINHLQEAMQTFDFQIAYKKGSDMPAYYLFCNLVHAITPNYSKHRSSIF